MEVSIIGGADGPTSIFLAGKLPPGGYLTAAFAGGIVAGVLLTVLILWLWKKK